MLRSKSYATAINSGRLAFSTMSINDIDESQFLYRPRANSVASSIVSNMHTATNVHRRASRSDSSKNERPRSYIEAVESNQK